MDSSTNIDGKSAGDLLNRASALAMEGMADEARALAASRNTQSTRDAALHRAWGKLCYELDLFNDAISEWNLAIRDEPGNIEPYRLLAELHEDQGNLERAERCWCKLIIIEPKSPEHYKRLGQIYERGSRFDDARRIYEQALAQTGDVSFEKLIRALRFLEEKPEEEPIEFPGAELTPADTDLVRFTTLFAGREGVYARQWISPTGEYGYTPIREPLTLAVARNHILGNHTIGAYQLRLDETVSFIAFDLDVPKYLAREGEHDPKIWRANLSQTHKAACLIVDRGAALEIPVYIEDSGYKGRHCWIFLERPVPAKIARRFATAFISGLHGFPGSVSVEIFPKQTRVKDDGLGNLIKLPLGIHRKTGKRSQFLLPDAGAYPNQIKLLSEIRSVTTDAILRALHESQASAAILPAQEFEEPNATEETEETKPFSTIRRPAEIYLPEKDKSLQYILSQCETLRRLMEKVTGCHEITHDEYLVLVHTLGHMETGPQAVNHILAQCYNVQPVQYMKSRLRGNPMSCPKIRSKIPHITGQSSCNCQFSGTQCAYPHPLLFLEEGTGGKPPVESLEFQNLMTEYLTLRKQVTEIQSILTRHEERIEAFFSQAGVDELQTPWGTVERKSAEGRVTYTLRI